MAPTKKKPPAGLARNVEILAANVKRLREKAEKSQEELAETAEVRQAMVSEVERGEANPTLESLTRLADALKVSLAALFEPAKR